MPGAELSLWAPREQGQCPGPWPPPMPSTVLAPTPLFMVYLAFSPPTPLPPARSGPSRRHWATNISPELCVVDADGGGGGFAGPVSPCCAVGGQRPPSLHPCSSRVLGRFLRSGTGRWCENSPLSPLGREDLFKMQV